MARQLLNNKTPAGPAVPPPRRRSCGPRIGPLLLLALAGAAVVYACKVCSAGEALALPVHDPERYGHLAVMAAALLGIVAIAKKVFSNRR